ncbi:uncharacterized protein B0H18DRAFT_992132 [Fomitopsis serialis]|uniref:uncharacterized protein n=1 Tax=Fomitopsis serialis TaxID=139415 RepID=UPI002007DBBB|nr:uncharacterized protein B0H18DRAFT_992132 [Neoantrodia serialis]KAH9930977.1 hypothetical protein B0H18DRAFT_992132 [Neoantrodia serialis]
MAVTKATTRSTTTKPRAAKSKEVKPKETKAKAPKAAAGKEKVVAGAPHPSFKDMIKECIVDHKEEARTGVSRATIKKYISEKYKLDLENNASNASHLNRAIASGEKEGIFALPKGPSGKVKLAPKNKPAANENAHPAGEKPHREKADKVTKPVAAAKPLKKPTAKADAPAKKTKAAAAPAKKTLKAADAPKKSTTKAATAPSKRMKKDAPAKKTTSAKANAKKVRFPHVHCVCVVDDCSFA